MLRSLLSHPEAIPKSRVTVQDTVQYKLPRLGLGLHLVDLFSFETTNQTENHPKPQTDPFDTRLAAPPCLLRHGGLGGLSVTHQNKKSQAQPRQARTIKNTSREAHQSI